MLGITRLGFQYAGKLKIHILVVLLSFYESPDAYLFVYLLVFCTSPLKHTGCIKYQRIVSKSKHFPYNVMRPHPDLN